jgi:vancomycin resistance protein YoaR
MKHFFRAVVVLAFLGHDASASMARSNVTPVQKVLDLLGGMLVKAKTAKKAEEVAWAEAKQYCTDVERGKEIDIEKELEELEVLKAEIQKAEADAEMLANYLTELDEELNAWRAQMNTSKVNSVEEEEQIKATDESYKESISALRRAITTLKAVSHNVKQDQTSLSQVAALKDLKLIPKAAKRAIDVYLMQDGEVPMQPDVTAQNPVAHAYEFQSGHIISLLQELLDKFIDEQHAWETGGANTKHDYEMIFAELKA